MFRRTVWFTAGILGGALTGAGVTAYGFVRLREARGSLAPDRVAESFVSSARRLGGTLGSSASTIRSGAHKVGEAVRLGVSESVAEGRAAMGEAEARIIADLDRRDRRVADSPDGAPGLGH